MFLKVKTIIKTKLLDKYFFVVNNVNMQVTIYTVPYCKFSQQEKDYLLSKGIAFTEKNLEENPVYLDEMLKISNNFAGTPVTVVVKDDGSQVVVKGFNQQELDSAIGKEAGVNLIGNNNDVNQANVSSQVISSQQDQTQQTPQQSSQTAGNVSSNSGVVSDNSVIADNQQVQAGVNQQQNQNSDIVNQMLSSLSGSNDVNQDLVSQINQVPQNQTVGVQNQNVEQQTNVMSTQTDQSQAQQASQTQGTQAEVDLQPGGDQTASKSDQSNQLQELLNKLNTVNQTGQTQAVVGQGQNATNQEQVQNQDQNLSNANQSADSPQSSGDLPDFNKNS
ncbi:MAG: hypothetical protein KatS3mg090_0672 [Patescibacteria group bacterium]|nr:MAG: hypothetical protein KatS3mg090_0672 [Patescibacteria group bacterium]